MAATYTDSRLNLRVVGKNNGGVVIEEIEGLIRVYKDGHVERPPAIPNVNCSVALDAKVTAKDAVIDKYPYLWARIYVPSSPAGKLPLLVYFHGGGFCIGSAAWSCYHEFLASLASKAGCVILSLNYRLAPENRLPAAYDDGVNALMWVKQQASNASSEPKVVDNQCNFSNLLLAGDSAGANIAYNVATRVGSSGTLALKGLVLIQPFFGGEARTMSEKHSIQPADSALNLSASDTYWRLSLPSGANRDHPWCNPLANGKAKLQELRIPPCWCAYQNLIYSRIGTWNSATPWLVLVRGLNHWCTKELEHAFQILHNSQSSQIRIQEMMSNLKAFLNR